MNGLLNILPIHASGYHNSTPPQSALDRVISSYASSLKSLAYARERAATANQVVLHEKTIIVAMPKTPDRKDLRFVEKEITDLGNLFSNSSINMRVMQNSTRKETLSELEHYIMAHFACHGSSETDPSQSSLLEDWKVAPIHRSNGSSSIVRG